MIRIPYADFNCLILPEGKEFEADFILLAVSLINKTSPPRRCTDIPSGCLSHWMARRRALWIPGWREYCGTI